MEVKDLYRATPLHNACDGGKVVHGPLYFFLMVTFYCSLFFFFFLNLGANRILRHSRVSFKPS